MGAKGAAFTDEAVQKSEEKDRCRRGGRRGWWPWRGHRREGGGHGEGVAEEAVEMRVRERRVLRCGGKTGSDGGLGPRSCGSRRGGRRLRDGGPGATGWRDGGPGGHGGSRRDALEAVEDRADAMKTGAGAGALCQCGRPGGEQGRKWGRGRRDAVRSQRTVDGRSRRASGVRWRREEDEEELGAVGVQSEEMGGQSHGVITAGGGVGAGRDVVRGGHGREKESSWARVDHGRMEGSVDVREATISRRRGRAKRQEELGWKTRGEDEWTVGWIQE